MVVFVGKEKPESIKMMRSGLAAIKGSMKYKELSAIFQQR